MLAQEVFETRLPWALDGDGGILKNQGDAVLHADK